MGEQASGIPDVPQPLLDEFLSAAHRIGAARLVRCSSGNLSVRVDDTHLLVSSSRSWLETLSPGEVSLCRLPDGGLVAGPRQSVETRFHAGILSTRPEVSGVLHFQSAAATAFCCRDSPADFAVIPEVPFYLGHIGWVPYATPGTRELADAVIAAMMTSDLALLQHHGLVTVAGDLEHLIQNAEFFELACSVMLANGETGSRIPVEEKTRLLELGAGERTLKRSR